MKTFKSINVSSNGSIYYSHSSETLLNNKLVIFQKQDVSNFVLNQKKSKKNIESKHSSYYKKKYLK